MKAVILCVLVFLSACTGPYQGDYAGSAYPAGCTGGRNTAAGIIGGAAAGGLIGNLASGRRGRTGNTLLGALGGGIVGGILGNASEQNCVVAVPVQQGPYAQVPAYGPYMSPYDNSPGAGYRPGQ